MARALKVMARLLAFGLLAIVLLALWAWAILAIYYSNLPGGTVRLVAAVVFGLGIPVAFVAVVWLRNWRLATLGFLAVFAVVFLWWYFIPASNDRDWVTEVAVVPRAEFDGNRVTVRNIRNFDYRSADDFTVQYYDRTFDLDQLQTVWFIVSHWDGIEGIAHTFASFEFAGDVFLSLSIEIRRENGESYSGLKGLFKQYEIIYVLADERDVIRLRTNYRGEDVYLYPTRWSPQEGRALLVDILSRANRLAVEPEFYRTLGRNCTTSLVNHVNTVSEFKVPLHRKVLMNGYSDELMYQRGRMATDLPFHEAKRAHYISEVARQHDRDPAFSRLIRAHLPKRPPTATQPTPGGERATESGLDE